MKNIIILLVITALMLSVTAMARTSFVEREYDCSECDVPLNECAARYVAFYDTETPGYPYNCTPYYSYMIYCDGGFKELWLGQTHPTPIGTIPTWGYPWNFAPVEETPSGFVERIFSPAGALVAKITYTGTLGDHAELVTYDPPMQ